MSSGAVLINGILSCQYGIIRCLAHIYQISQNALRTYSYSLCDADVYVHGSATYFWDQNENSLCYTD